MIERLTRLHLEGDQTVYPALAKEWDRRGERWCSGGKPPIMHATIFDMADYISELHPFSQPDYEAFTSNHGDVSVFFRGHRPPASFHSPLAAAFALALDGTARVMTWDDRYTGDLDLRPFITCANPSLMLCRVFPCQEKGQVRAIVPRLCRPITLPHQDQQPTPVEVP